MRTYKLRPVLSLAPIKKEFVRNVGVNGASVRLNDDVALKSWKDIPGPTSLPIIGTMLNFLPGGDFANLNGLDLTNKLYNKYGPIVRLDSAIGLKTIIFLYDAEATAQVLRGENWLPVRPGFTSLEYYRKNKKNEGQSRTPTGLITEHGDMWKEFRSTVNPVLLQPKTIKLYSDAIDEVAMDMIKRMKSNRDEKNMLKGNFDVEMNLWALESIGVVALGCRLNCFGELPEDSPERRLIQCVHDAFITADQLDFKPSIWRYFATPTFKKAMKLYKEQEDLSKYFIEKARAELQRNKKSNEEKGVLEKLLDINEEFALIMAQDMLFAGVDTAANTITGNLYLLAKNPDKQNKLREELLTKKDKRPYLRACLKEAMRMMPVVSGNIRTTSKEYNLMGYLIPKNMQVAFAHQNMSLMEEHYPKALEYTPERWLAEKLDPLYHGNAHPFAHGPFGFGVRSCIGRRIAELEMETFLARVIENFQVEWFGEPPRVYQTSLNYIKGPFNFIFKDL